MIDGIFSPPFFSFDHCRHEFFYNDEVYICKPVSVKTTVLGRKGKAVIHTPLSVNSICDD